MITELPMSPRSLMGEYNFFKFSARRALQELAPNDPKLNMKVAENLLTISADHFKRKWNFDPIAMKPTQGSFVWTPLQQQQKEKDEVSSSETRDPLGSCCRIPNPESSKITEKPASQFPPHDEPSRLRLPSLPVSTQDKSQSPVAKKIYQKSTRSTRSAVLARRCPRLASPKARQRKITEFGRQRKRLNSTSKSETDLDSSPRKKIMLDPTLKS